MLYCQYMYEISFSFTAFPVKCTFKETSMCSDEELVNQKHKFNCKHKCNVNSELWILFKISRNVQSPFFHNKRYKYIFHLWISYFTCIFQAHFITVSPMLKNKLCAYK